MAKLPEFKHTDVDAIPALCKEVRTSFLTHKSRSLEWRLTQLRKLYWGYVISIHESSIRIMKY